MADTQGLRFEFGANWASYAELVDEHRIGEATRRLSALLGTPELAGRTFLDIGCGSGLHALAALRLGAAHVHAVDLDERSVATARALLERHGRGSYAVTRADVLELERHRLGRFDIVYSWGVLHHTGNLRQALMRAAAQVRPGGVLALALYGRTRWCGAWSRVKRWYVRATPEQRARAEALYVRLFGAYLRLRGQRLADHVAAYQAKRGMDFLHDVRDWLGGYPYESIRPRDLKELLAPARFRLVHEKVTRRSGLFGSGNDEYLFRLEP